MIFKAPATDGLYLKCKSSKNCQAPVPFDEFLKDEEKKLRQEQEVSASSVAAVLSALQPQPEMVTASYCPRDRRGGESVNSDGMRASDSPADNCSAVCEQPFIPGRYRVKSGWRISRLQRSNQTDAAQTQANQMFADPCCPPEIPQSNINTVGSVEVFPVTLANLDPVSDQGA